MHLKTAFKKRPLPTESFKSFVKRQSVEGTDDVAKLADLWLTNKKARLHRKPHTLKPRISKKMSALLGESKGGKKKKPTGR